MAFINRASVDEDTGRVFVLTDAPQSEDPFLAGIRYESEGDNAMYVQDTAVTGSATFQDGIARDDDGVMFVIIDDAPTGSDAVFNDGMLCDITGRLSMTTVNPIDVWVHGWPLDEDGSVCIIGGVVPPPDVGTFDTIILIQPGNPPYDNNRSVYMGSIYYGITEGVDGFSEDSSVFLPGHPGGTTQDFSSFAVPDNTLVAVPAIPDFTPTMGPAINPGSTFRLQGGDGGFDPLTDIRARWIATTGVGGGNAIILTFDALISTIGFQWGYSGSTFDEGWSVAIYNGATLVESSTVTPTEFGIRAGNFVGYHKGGAAPASDRRITGDSDIRVTSDGDTRVWV